MKIVSPCPAAPTVAALWYNTDSIILFVLKQVSIFLKDKVQNSNGRFVLPVAGAVPYGAEIPGSIR